MEIDKQRDIWKRRIREIQYLSCVVIVYFGMFVSLRFFTSSLHISLREAESKLIIVVNNKVAILALCWLIYSTFATEIENMLTPPTSMDEIYDYIDKMERSAPRNQVSLSLPLSPRPHFQSAQVQSPLFSFILVYLVD